MIFRQPRFLDLILLLQATSEGRIQVPTVSRRVTINYLVQYLLIVLDSKVTTGQEHVTRRSNIRQVPFLLSTVINRRTNASQ